jgi:general secretion pathway protein L
MLPGVFKRARRDGRTVLLLDVTASHVAAVRCSNGKRTELARIPRPAAAGRRESGATGPARRAFAALEGAINPEVIPVMIRVPADELLTRTVILPAAAAENLRQVIGFEMNRYTPFAEEDVYFDYHPLPPPQGDPRLHLELAIVRRAVVDPVLRALPPWNLRVGGAVARPDLGDQGLLLRLAPAEAAKKGGRVLGRLLWAANAAMLAAVLAVPFLQQEKAIAGLEQRVAVARAEAESADALYRRFDELREQRSFLIDKKRNALAVVTLLAELSATLPDTTWVQQLEVKSGKVFIRGTSAKASELIRIIEESESFRRATFDAPVTRNPSTGDEHFRLVFEIAPPTQGGEDVDEKDIRKNAGTVAVSRRFAERR